MLYCGNYRANLEKKVPQAANYHFDNKEYSQQFTIRYSYTITVTIVVNFSRDLKALLYTGASELWISLSEVICNII
jgi:hypothetical protein